jgi:hypothetical protein
MPIDPIELENDALRNLLSTFGEQLDDLYELSKNQGERIEKLERLIVNARVGMSVLLGGIVDEYGPIVRRKG